MSSSWYMVSYSEATDSVDFGQYLMQGKGPTLTNDDISTLKDENLQLREKTVMLEAKVKLLEQQQLRKRSSINRPTPNIKQRELFEACYQGDVVKTRFLLSNCLPDEVDVNAKYDELKHGPVGGGRTWWCNGWTCLMFASRQGHLDMVKMLLREFRANANQQNENGDRPIHWASANGHIDVVRLLCSSEGRANAEAKTWMGSTPLIDAVRRGHFEVVEFLVVDQGVRVNERNNDGKTALALSQDQPIAELLMRHSASL